MHRRRGSTGIGVRGSIGAVPRVSAMIFVLCCCTTRSPVVEAESDVGSTTRQRRTTTSAAASLGASSDSWQHSSDSTALVPPRRVIAWMSADCFAGSKATACTGSASDNTTDILRQATEAERRAAKRQLTDLSPTTYRFAANGTVVYDRCGPVCEALQPRFVTAGLRVVPLVAAFNIPSIMGNALLHPLPAARNLLNLTLAHGYAGINLDLEPLDCQHCASPSNCTVETAALLRFLDTVGTALHSHGKELQIDYAAWMQTHNFGSYETIAATAVDTICSMDTYGKLGDVFGWITQLNMAASCQLAPGTSGQYPCNGMIIQELLAFSSRSLLWCCDVRFAQAR